jgi:hypothetical protein
MSFKSDNIAGIMRQVDLPPAPFSYGKRGVENDKKNKNPLCEAKIG